MRRIGVWFLGIIIAGAVIHQGWLNGTGQFFLPPIKPFLLGITAVTQGVEKIGTTLGGISSNVEAIKDLRIENHVLRSRLADFEEIKKENEMLRKMVGREPDAHSLLYARVIGRSPVNAKDVLLLDRGSSHGIEKGLRVLAPGNILLGYIVDVSSSSAVTQLVSDIGKKTEVYFPKSSITSIADGEGLGVLAVEVPTQFSITEGEPVFGVGPPDFLLGYVEKIDRPETGLFQIIKVGFPISASDLRHVFIVMP